MKPILFNTEMVRAILDGRKTTTRRVIKPQPINGIMTAAGLLKAIPEHMNWGGKVIKPTYQKGDVLYVRETWGISNFDEDESIITVQYKADDTASNVVLPPDKFQKYYDNMTGAEPDYRPSIFMPKEAARIFLRVTDVKAERLQDIDDEGAKNEGSNVGIGVAEKMCRGAIDRFAEIWNRTVKKSDLNRYGWNANPWVWVISFERTARPDEK